MTPEIVNEARGNRVKPNYFLFTYGKSKHAKDEQVVLKMYVKEQLCVLYDKSKSWVDIQTTKIDERSMEMYLKLGRKYIDLTEPRQADIDHLRTIYKPISRRRK